MKINKKNIRLAIKQLKENDIGADEYLSELFQEKKAILKAKKGDKQMKTEKECLGSCFHEKLLIYNKLDNLNKAPDYNKEAGKKEIIKWVSERRDEVCCSCHKIINLKWRKEIIKNNL